MDDEQFKNTLSVIKQLIVECPDVSELIDEIKDFLNNAIRLIGYWDNYEIKFNTKNELYILLNHDNMEYYIEFPSIVGNCNKKGFWKKGF